MTVFYNRLQETYLGYAALFVCIGFGFLFLRRVAKGEVGPGYWSASFFLSGGGFLLWSCIMPVLPRLSFLIGEVLHILGFMALVCGAYRFAGTPFQRWNIFALGGWTVLWAGSIGLIADHPHLAGVLLKSLRGILFIWAGRILLVSPKIKPLAGRTLAGWCLVAWGLYVAVFSFVRLSTLPWIQMAFGFQVGFHVLAALGMVVLIWERMRLRAEESENRVRRLEGLLPICAYCKKIRDEQDHWESIETYVREHSEAEFSHGICPECAGKHFPGFKNYKKNQQVCDDMEE